MSDPPLPSFLIIGAQKSATRWLRYNLGLHPEIFTASREVSFFNSSRAFHRLGLAWYRAQFGGWSGEPIVGEATPGYMIWRHRPKLVAQRIKATIPEVRLIAILRDPVERANSALVHHIRRQRVHPDVQLVDMVRHKPPEEDRMGLIAGGWYEASLKPYVNLFGDQLLIFLHEEIRRDPDAVYERALRHVGAKPGFVPADLGALIFSNQEGESARLRRQVSAEDRAELYEYFRSDVRKLERMLDRDLSQWKPRESGPNDEDEFGPAILDPATHITAAANWIETLIQTAWPQEVNGATPNGAATRTLARLVARSEFFAETLEQHRVPDAYPDFDVDDGNVLRDEPLTAYRAAADLLTATLARPGILEGRVSTPFRDLPASVYAARALTTHVVDGWELAKDLGQDATIPYPLASVVRPVAERLAVEEHFRDRGLDTQGSSDAETRMRRFVEVLPPPTSS